MAKYSAKFTIVCPVQMRGKFNPGRGVFDIATCGRKITGSGESEISQEDAQNKAEFQASGKFSGHMRSHDRKRDSL